MAVASLLKCSAIVFLVFGVSFTVIYASHVCGFCPAGYFVKRCANATSPVCEECPTGTYVNTRNDFRKCHWCSGCFGKNNIEVHACNRTHDTACRCRKGYWYDSGALFCTPCKSCGRGRGVIKMCTHNSNTVCRRCEKHKTYSAYKSQTEGCLDCTKCLKDEIVTINCTRRVDRKCSTPVNRNYGIRKKNKSKWPVRSTVKPPDSDPKTVHIIDDNKDSRDDAESDKTSTTANIKGSTKTNQELFKPTIKLVLIVGGCVVIFIIGVLIAVFISRRKKSRSPKTSAPPRTTNPAPPRVSTLTTKGDQNRLSTIPLMNGSTDKLFRDVCYTLTDELSRLLNPKERWKILAGKLGFKTLDIESFKLQPMCATANMLFEWGQRRESTLHSLCDTLLKMKWHSEADIVRKYL